MRAPSNIAPCMSVATQVEYESRVRFRYGVVTFVAAVLLIGSQLVQLVGPTADVSEATLGLVIASKRQALDVLSAVTYLIGMFALAASLGWLFQVSRYRNPGMKPFTRWLAVGGAALAGIMYLVYLVVLGIKGHQFVSSGNQGYPEANALTSGLLIRILPFLWQLGTLLLALGIVWVSLNAIRVGLVTKLVGYVGVVAGALFVFPIGAIVPIVQAFWLASLSVIMVARWPGGDPPAWRAGEAIPWPSAQNQQAARAPRQARGQRRKVSDSEVLAAVDGSQAPRTEAPSPSTSAGKRKRKRK